MQKCHTGAQEVSTFLEHKLIVLVTAHIELAFEVGKLSKCASGVRLIWVTHMELVCSTALLLFVSQPCVWVPEIMWTLRRWVGLPQPKSLCCQCLAAATERVIVIESIAAVLAVICNYISL